MGEGTRKPQKQGVLASTGQNGSLLAERTWGRYRAWEKYLVVRCCTQKTCMAYNKTAVSFCTKFGSRITFNLGEEFHSIWEKNTTTTSSTPPQSRAEQQVNLKKKTEDKGSCQATPMENGGDGHQEEQLWTVHRAHEREGGGEMADDRGTVAPSSPPWMPRCGAAGRLLGPVLGGGDAGDEEVAGGGGPGRRRRRAARHGPVRLRDLLGDGGDSGPGERGKWGGEDGRRERRQGGDERRALTCAPAGASPIRRLPPLASRLCFPLFDGRGAGWSARANSTENGGGGLGFDGRGAQVVSIPLGIGPDFQRRIPRPPKHWNWSPVDTNSDFWA